MATAWRSGDAIETRILLENVELMFCDGFVYIIQDIIGCAHSFLLLKLFVIFIMPLEKLSRLGKSSRWFAKLLEPNLDRCGTLGNKLPVILPHPHACIAARSAKVKRQANDVCDGS